MHKVGHSLRITLRLGLSRAGATRIVKSRIRGEKIRPELVPLDKLRCPAAYKRFSNLEAKEVFRQELRKVMTETWVEEYGLQQAEKLAYEFSNLAKRIADDGAVIFGDLIPRNVFTSLVRSYDDIMSNDGSRGLLHSYVNLRNHPGLLLNRTINGAFLHPLAVALIADRIGEPVRVTDARGKDAEPLEVRAQDNMLHIDNTPFNDEYKIILMWERGKASGPIGQNFVYLPGTHKGARNCVVSPELEPFSTENASIFVTENDVDMVLKCQQHIQSTNTPLVVEVTDHRRPLTAIFAAGSLVHHRYRTQLGAARSCIILAFHSAVQHPGRFLPGTSSSDNNSVERAVFDSNENAAQTFMMTIAKNARAIADKLEEIVARSGAVLIDVAGTCLTGDRLSEWILSLHPLT